MHVWWNGPSQQDLWLTINATKNWYGFCCIITEND